MIVENIDPRMVARAQAGDHAAFAALWRECKHMVYVSVKARTITHEQAEDMVSETFLRAWRGIGDTRPDTNFAGWVHTIALNILRDHLRSGHRRLSSTVDFHEFEWDAPGERDPAELVADMDAWHRLPLDELTATQRRVLELRYVDDLKWEQVAVRMGRSEQAVKSASNRALVQLGRHIKRMERR